MSEIAYLTKEKMKEIESELNDLKTRGRKEIAQKIADARSHGDLSENADYDAAKDEQALMELKISKLSAILSKSRVIDASDFPDDKVYILTKVKVKNQANNQIFDFLMVGAEEADYEKNKISITSPLGKALMGKAIGEVAIVKVPTGEVRYEIMEISK